MILSQYNPSDKCFYVISEYWVEDDSIFAKYFCSLYIRHTISLNDSKRLELFYFSVIMTWLEREDLLYHVLANMTLIFRLITTV